jgi:hypothetical protein
MPSLTFNHWVAYGLILYACLMLVVLTMNRQAAEYDRAFTNDEPVRSRTRLDVYSARVRRFTAWALARLPF